MGRDKDDIHDTELDQHFAESEQRLLTDSQFEFDDGAPRHRPDNNLKLILIGIVGLILVVIGILWAFKIGPFTPEPAPELPASVPTAPPPATPPAAPVKAAPEPPAAAPADKSKVAKKAPPPAKKTSKKKARPKSKKRHR